MSTNPSNAATLGDVFDVLRDELGKRQVVWRDGDPNAPIAYLHPGGEHPLLIFAHETPMGPSLRLDAPVADNADWQGSKLSEFLLLEQGSWLFGRAERWGDGIVIEHCLRADGPVDQISSLVLALADTALRLRGDLVRMGALTTLEEAA